MITPIPVLHYDTIDSTNSEARRLWEQGEAGPIWIVSDAQTAGRGRLGRQWHSKPGNLYSTLLFSPGSDQSKAGQIGFVAALAVHDVATNFTKNTPITLKWPNDCLLGGAKLCGILSEIISQSPPVMALGIGMNIAHAPENMPYATACLSAHAPQVTVKATHEVLSSRLQYWLQIWARGANFPAIKTAWETHALNINQPVSVDTGAAIRHGIFKGLNEDGAMIMIQESGAEITIYAGDVRATNHQEK